MTVSTKPIPSAEPRPITVTVNGKAYTAQVEPRTNLTDFLHEQLHINGVRSNCEHGICGACAVLLNGKSVRSCLTLAVQADGQHIVTIDGLANGDKLHPIQEAFWEEHGLQCGFCTGGIIMSIHELLEASPNPTDTEIYDTLGGHVCRCTGYQQIYNSVKRAVELLKKA